MHIMSSKAWTLKINTHQRAIKPHLFLSILEVLLGEMLELLGRTQALK